jgi:hypothetical protein
VLVGVAVTAVTYLGMISLRDPNTETVEFDQREIESAIDVAGDERPTATLADKRLLNAYRQDTRLYLPDTGWRATIARKWASPAFLDLDELASYTEASGDVDVELSTDPLADQAVDVTPAHLAFDPELVRPATDQERVALEERVAQATDRHPLLGLVSSLTGRATLFVRRVNWRLLGISGAGLAAGWVGGSALGIPLFGLALGTLPGLAAATRARDGHAEWWPAP